MGRSVGGSDEAPPQYNFTQITRDTGFTGDPALSPDGRLLAYASDRSGDGNLDIWVQQLGGGDPIRLTTGDADEFEPEFSPDGNRIVYRSRAGGGGIYVVPALGGNPRRIGDAGATPRFSPDGGSICYSVLHQADNENRMFAGTHVVSSSGSAPRQVNTDLSWVQSCSWSPDGKQLLVVGGREPTEFGRRRELDWWLLPAEGGAAIPLNVGAQFEAAGIQLGRPFPRPARWLAGQNWVIFSAQMQDGATQNIWRIRIAPDQGQVLGQPQRLTAGIGEGTPSVSQYGRIAFMSGDTDWDIWSLPLDADRVAVQGETQRIVSGLSTDQYPSISADGRMLIYTSDRSGNNDIWARDLVSGNDTAVTVNPAPDFRGVVSPDGAKVVFGRGDGERLNVYLTALGRGAERLLVEGVGNATDWAPDGKKILFYTSTPIRWKTIDVATGKQQDLGLQHDEFPVHNVRLSPDQNWVAFNLRAPSIPLYISPLIQNVARPHEDWISLGEIGGGPSGHAWWSPDGNTLYFLSDQDEFLCIWAQVLDARTKQPRGPPKAVQHFHDRLRIRGAAPFGYATTADKLYLPIGETKGNIWLAEPRRAN